MLPVHYRSARGDLHDTVVLGPKMASSFFFFLTVFLYWSIADLEKAMAPHSSILAWKIPWMEEPRRLQSMGLLRVGHD